MRIIKRKKLYIFLFIAILFLSFSNPIYGVEKNNKFPPVLKNKLKANNELEITDIDKLKSKFKNHLYQFNDLEYQLPTEAVKIDRSLKKPGFLSEKKLIEDVNYFFKILKYGYSGYQYFGGDEKFNYAKEVIINEINEKSFLNLLSTDKFVNILKSNLSFIQDLHFAIDGDSLGNRYLYYMSTVYQFNKDEKGFYTILNNQKAYIKEVKNYKIDELMKLSINEQGGIIYRLGKVAESKQGKDIEVNIEFKFPNNETVNKKIMLVNPERKRFNNQTPYNLYQKEGIDIIEHRTASASKKNIEKLKKLAEEASNFRDNKLLIIDLRNNSGGSDLYASDWVENLTGVQPGEGIIASNLATATANRLLLNSFNQIYGMKYSELEGEYKSIFEKTKSGWTEVQYHKYKLIENDIFIFVLIDKGVSSAGESFVNYLAQMENTIFIGTNTNGLLSFGNMGMCNLPNSNIELFISKTISLPPDLKSREGYGYYPDFWVPSIDSLDITLEFIKRYF